MEFCNFFSRVCLIRRVILSTVVVDEVFEIDLFCISLCMINVFDVVIESFIVLLILLYLKFLELNVFRIFCLVLLFLS